MKKKHIANKVQRVVLIVLIALLLGISVYNFNASRVFGDELPLPFGINFLVVLSGSMEPELSINDLVVVRKTDDFKEQQIVVFQSGDILVVHRIVSVGEDTVITKGDANNTDDGEISVEKIKGEVVLAIPYVGVVISFLKNPLIVCILLAGAIFLMERSFIKEKDKKSDELAAIKDEIKEMLEDMKK